jgi:predicted amidohydrolase YtcJ
MKAKRIVRLPYLHDHHSHVSLYASFEGLPDLTGLDRTGAMRLLGGLPGDRLNLVKGWRTDRLPLVSREASADFAGLPPVIVVNASLHGYALSPAALPFVAELWPEFAENASDPAWGERNLPRLFSFYGRAAGLDAGKLAAFMTKMEALGLGSLEDMTLAGEEALAIESGSPFGGRILSWATPEVYRSLSGDSRRKCAGIKIFLDGSLGARSAALDAPFSDGKEGGLLYGDEELSILLAELASYRAAISMHALGHLAIAQALRVLAALEEDGLRFPSARLEHVQFMSPDQARRCKAFGVVLSMQPNFNSDSSDYADRLIRRHRKENDPFRMLIDEAGFVPGQDLLFGSDGMPHGPEFALRWGLYPEHEGQRLAPEELASGYGPARGIEGEGSAFALDDEARAVSRVDRG